ncbi:DUF393 domain-containing protein (plasmid) [Cupriavidus metallidurans]|nr:DUF393 domain-containing protein [Cupriavidus metallidurans]
MEGDQMNALVLYFDGKCPFCAAEMRRLSEWDTQHQLAFVDIAQEGFDCSSLNVDLAALNRELHGRTSDGRLLVGIDCMIAAYTLAGHGWLVLPLRVPGLRRVLANLYRAFAGNRYTLSRWLGYGTATACDGDSCGTGNPFLSGKELTDAAEDRPARRDSRQLAVRWMYAAAIAHLLVGAAMPWAADATLFGTYHRIVEQSFWSGAAPAQARAQQVWWIALFGATLQCSAIWMLALVHLGNRTRHRMAWGWLLVGLLVWAPQDLLISLQAHVWPHVLVDAVALLTMIPPLLYLWRKDAA